jgi:hypothetical protein
MSSPSFCLQLVRNVMNPTARISTRQNGRVLLLLLGLSGCTAIGPAYQTPALPVPATWSGIAAQPAEDISAWWQRLQDPILDQLIA